MAAPASEIKTGIAAQGEKQQGPEIEVISVEYIERVRPLRSPDQADLELDRDIRHLNQTIEDKGSTLLITRTQPEGSEEEYLTIGRKAENEGDEPTPMLSFQIVTGKPEEGRRSYPEQDRKVVVHDRNNATAALDEARELFYGDAHHDRLTKNSLSNDKREVGRNKPYKAPYAIIEVAMREIYKDHLVEHLQNREKESSPKDQIDAETAQITELSAQLAAANTKAERLKLLLEKKSGVPEEKADQATADLGEAQNAAEATNTPTAEEQMDTVLGKVLEAFQDELRRQGLTQEQIDQAITSLTQSMGEAADNKAADVLRATLGSNPDGNIIVNVAVGIIQANDEKTKDQATTTQTVGAQPVPAYFINLEPGYAGVAKAVGEQMVRMPDGQVMRLVPADQQAVQQLRNQAEANGGAVTARDVENIVRRLLAEQPARATAEAQGGAGGAGGTGGAGGKVEIAMGAAQVEALKAATSAFEKALESQRQIFEQQLNALREEVKAATKPALKEAVAEAAKSTTVEDGSKLTKEQAIARVEELKTERAGLEQQLNGLRERLAAIPAERAGLEQQRAEIQTQITTAEARATQLQNEIANRIGLAERLTNVTGAIALLGLEGAQVRELTIDQFNQHAREALFTQLTTGRRFSNEELAALGQAPSGETGTYAITIRGVMKNEDGADLTDAQLVAMQPEQLIQLMRANLARLEASNEYPPQTLMLREALAQFGELADVQTAFTAYVNGLPENERAAATFQAFAVNFSQEAQRQNLGLTALRAEIDDLRAQEANVNNKLDALGEEEAKIQADITAIEAKIAVIDANIAILQSAHRLEGAENPNGDIEGMTHEQLIAEYKRLKEQLDLYEQLGAHITILTGLNPARVRELLGDQAPAGWEGENWPQDGLTGALLIVYLNKVLETPPEGFTDAQKAEYQALVAYLQGLENADTLRFYGANDTDPHTVNNNITNIVVIINNALGSPSDRAAQLARMQAIQARAQRDGINLNGEGAPATPETSAATAEANARALANVNLLALGLEKVEDKPRGWLRKVAELVATVAGSKLIKGAVAGAFIGITGVASGGILPVVGAIAVSALGGGLTKAFIGSYMHYEVFHKDKPHAMWAENGKPPKRMSPFHAKMRNDLIQALGVQTNLQASASAFAALAQLNMANPGAFKFQGDGDNAVLPGTQLTRQQILNSFTQMYQLRKLTNFAHLEGIEPKVSFKDATGAEIPMNQALEQLGRQLGAIMAENGMGPDTDAYKQLVEKLDKDIETTRSNTRSSVVTKNKFIKGAVIGGVAGTVFEAWEHYSEGGDFNFFGGWFDRNEPGFLTPEQFEQLDEQSDALAETAHNLDVEIGQVDAANQQLVMLANQMMNDADPHVVAEGQTLLGFAQQTTEDINDFRLDLPDGVVGNEGILADLGTQSDALENIQGLPANQFLETYREVVGDMAATKAEILSEADQLASRGEFLIQFGQANGLDKVVEYGETLQQSSEDLAALAEDVDLQFAEEIAAAAEAAEESGGAAVAVVENGQEAAEAGGDAADQAEALRDQAEQLTEQRAENLEQIRALSESRDQIEDQIAAQADALGGEQFSYLHGLDSSFTQADFDAVDLNDDGILYGAEEFERLNQVLGSVTTIPGGSGGVSGLFLNISDNADGNYDQFIFPSSWSSAHGYMAGSANADVSSVGFLQGGQSGLGWGSIGHFFQDNGFGMDQVDNVETARAAHAIVVQFQNGADSLQDAIAGVNPNLIEGTVFENAGGWVLDTSGAGGGVIGSVDLGPVQTTATEFLNFQQTIGTQLADLNAQIDGLQDANLELTTDIRDALTEAERLEALAGAGGEAAGGNGFAVAAGNFWEEAKERAENVWGEWGERDVLAWAGLTAGTGLYAAWAYDGDGTGRGTSAAGGRNLFQRAADRVRGRGPESGAGSGAGVGAATAAAAAGAAATASATATATTGQQGAGTPAQQAATAQAAGTPNQAGPGIVPRRNPVSNRLMAPEANWRTQDGAPPPAWAFRHPALYGLGVRAANAGTTARSVGREAAAIFGVGGGGNPFENNLIEDIRHQTRTNNRIYFLDPQGRVQELDATIPENQQRTNRREVVGQINGLRNDIRNVLAREIPGALSAEFPGGIDAAIGNVPMLGQGQGEALKGQAQILQRYLNPGEGSRFNLVNQEMADAYLQLLMIYNDPANIEGGRLNAKGAGEANFVLTTAASRDADYRSSFGKFGGTRRDPGIPYTVTAAINRIALQQSGFNIPATGPDGQPFDVFSNISQLTRTVAEVDPRGGLHNALVILANQGVRGGAPGQRPQRPTRGPGRFQEPAQQPEQSQAGGFSVDEVIAPQPLRPGRQGRGPRRTGQRTAPPRP